MAKIARTGRGISAVKAGELVLAYAEGKPVANISVTARAPLDDRFRGAARSMLEAAVAEAEALNTPDADTETVALDVAPAVEANDSACLARALPPVEVDRGQAVTISPPDDAGTTEGGTP
jgi:antitoxin (DNA-binding transcriptional repressor) of toxin-antitoxin stability system